MQRNDKSVRRNEALLMLRDAAFQLAISYSTIKQWIYKKKIRSIQTAGHHRIPQSEVDRLLFRTRAERRKSASRLADTSAESNQIVGRIDRVRISGLMAEVRISIGDQHITSIITAGSASEMQLKVGQTTALIKATDVMILRV
jgi:molybdopterin-binding protein